jgi:hypothetical protein
VHRRRADLALGAAGLQQLAGVDPPLELRLVSEDAVHAQDVRDQVVGEDREPVEVVELGDAGEREVVGGDLGALPEPLVVEEGHLGEGLRQPLGRAAGRPDRIQRAALAEPVAEVVEGLRVQGHQFVAALLAERVRNGIR